MIWHPIPSTLKRNKVVSSSNQPKESGNYLCTCVRWDSGGNKTKYISIVHYDKARNCWHDIDNAFGRSHSVLAWAEGVEVCDFDNFEYHCGHILSRS